VSVGNKLWFYDSARRQEDGTCRTGNTLIADWSARHRPSLAWFSTKPRISYQMRFFKTGSSVLLYNHKLQASGLSP